MIATNVVSANPSLSWPTESLRSAQSIEAECLNTLRFFIASEQITQLVAFDVCEPGARTSYSYAGFFDYQHLDQMAHHAARFSGIARGVHFTLNPLKPEAFERCPNRLLPVRKGVLACDNDVLSRSWLMIDFDPVRPSGISATDSEKRCAWNTLECVCSFLNNAGFPPPIIGDSGNGYHLYFRIALPAQDKLPHRLLKTLSEQFGSAEVEIDTTVGSASQLTKLFGTRSAKGQGTADRPHRPSSILSIPHLATLDADVLGRLLPSARPNVSTSGRIPNGDNVVQRARSYLARMPPSISGQHGHDRLFEAACRLVQGFALSIPEALPLLREFNSRAEPTWSESELLHKLEDAQARSGVRSRGYLLIDNVHPASPHTEAKTSSSSDELAEPLSGQPFPIAIPDFIPAPTRYVGEYLADHWIEARRGRPKFDYDSYLYWLALHGIYTQQVAPVVVPDVVVAAGLGGASPSKGWRNRLLLKNGRKRLSIEAVHNEQQRLRAELSEIIPTLEAAVESGQSERADILALADRVYAVLDHQSELKSQMFDEGCPVYCPLHGSRDKHEHYVLRPGENLLGSLAELGTKTAASAFTFDFDMKQEGQPAHLDTLLRSNKIQWAYLPVQIFGQAAGLSPRQIRLVQGLMRERTRTKTQFRQNAAKPRLVIIRNARVKAVLRDAEITCPFLNNDEKYVAFGGNFKKRRGQGYQLMGTFDDDFQRQGGWLRRLGYPATRQMAETEEERVWRWIRIMLDDLADLAPSLGLIAGAIDGVGRWRSLDELRVMIKEARNRPWLKRCSLRVFAPDDHLIRWRQWFAERLGYSFISGGDWSCPEDVAMVEAIRPTAESIRARMFASGIKGKSLAAYLGWTESRVSRQLAGKTALSNELIAAAQQLMPDLSCNEIADALG